MNICTCKIYGHNTTPQSRLTLPINLYDIGILPLHRYLIAVYIYQALHVSNINCQHILEIHRSIYNSFTYSLDRICKKL